MPVYREKLLELKSIENNSDKYFLQIRLSFEQDVEMLWEIDEYTAKNLKAITQFDGKYKYRLSFNNSWNEVQKQHISLLVPTYCEQSYPIYFSCSEDYINKLMAIKHCQNINDLGKIPFASENFELVYEDYEEKKKHEKANDNNLHKKFIPNFTFASVALMSIIFIILFSYSNHNCLNKTTFNEKVLAQAIQLDNEIIPVQNEALEIENVIIIEDSSSNQPIIPIIELEKTLTYSIPKGSVALTFDDGPSQYSREIMDILKEYQVGGTFFFIGSNVKKYPDYVQYIYSNGYSVGSHSMSHSNLKTLSYEKQEYELIQSIKLLEEITEGKINLFRPPYGSFNKQFRDIVNENDYRMVLWNNDPKDWITLDADKILSDIINSNVSGAIILLHESQAVIDALPRIIEYLQELDLEIVSLQ